MSNTETVISSGEKRKAVFRQLLTAYFVSAGLMICHEIDSACWAEWDLFALPGGAPFFVILHLILVPVVLFGLVQVVREDASSRWLALVLGAGGTLGSIVHGIFLFTGDGRFGTLLSTGLIVLFGLFSVYLLVVVMTNWNVIVSQE